MGLMVTEDANADMGPIRTTNRWLFVFLEVIVHKAKDEG